MGLREPALTGRPMRVLVTGSSTGIGRALTLRLLDAGHAVWGWARSDQAALAAARPAFRATRTDVADWAAVHAGAEEIAAAWGGLDALVTCAGVQGEIGRALAADPLRWSETIRANLDGTYFTLRACAPLLARAERRAKAVCFSGGGATKPRPNFSAYGAAKTAVVRLVETIAAEERERPFDINALAPGAIHTRLTEEVLALGPAVAGAAEFAAAQRQRADDPAPLARALDCVEWLLSPRSDGISGRLLAAPWDPWTSLRATDLTDADTYTLRRIVPPGA